MRIQRGKLPGVKPTIFKLREGGTGSSTPDGALTALDAVPASLIDKPGGVLSLDSSRKLKPDVIAGLSVSGVSIDGPTSMSINQSLPFTITDYDSFLTYNIAAIGGSVSRSGDTITYTAPSSAGPSGFTINGKTISVAVGANIVMAPTINNIINGATNISSTINLTTTAFTVSGGSDTHQWTDWQVATDAGFTTIVSQSLSDTVNKLSWTSGTLSVNTTYYARVRHKGNAFGYSNWSNVVSFTTKAIFAPTNEVSKFVYGGVTGSFAGYSISISGDGTRVAIGVPYATQFGYSNAGFIYIFIKQGTSWDFEAALRPSDMASNKQFGVSVSMDSTGTRVAVGALIQDSDGGNVYIFTRSGVTWTQEAKLVAGDPSSTKQFGFSVAIDNGGNRVIVGSPNSISTGGALGGAAYIFLRTGVSWAQEAKIIATDHSSNYKFGYSVCFDDTATRAIIGDTNRAVSGNGTCGSAYIFLRSGTSWAQEAVLEPQLGNVGLSSNMGNSVSMDSAGNRVVVGIIGNSSYRGAVIIYLRTGVSWAQETILNVIVPSSQYNYGSSVSINDNGDMIAIGSSKYGNTGAKTGAAFIHTRSGVSWDTIPVILPSGGVDLDYFGYSISLSGSGGVMAVGAPLTNGTLTDTGAFYIFT